MCYVCSCFAWTLDLIQRIITFALSCLIAFALCCGMAIAIIAGIAYGYNYSLAEFLTFTRSDVSAFMRRGRFIDKPDIIFSGSERRSVEEDDILSRNITTDYQDNNLRSNSKPLSHRWLRTKDIRKYAEKLTKYYSQNVIIDQEQADNLNYSDLTTPLLRHISMTPIPGLSTTVWQTGSSRIIMRFFRPVERLNDFNDYNRKDYESFDKNAILHSKNKVEQQKQDMESIIRATKTHLSGNIEERNSLMPVSSRYQTSRVPDYPTEEVDEDNIVYKPV